MPTAPIACAGRQHERVLGEPYHTMVPGYATGTVNMLRLWRARATKEFDFQKFDYGDYALAVEEKIRTENITKVLYPNDNTPQGRELRLKQQYFFVACSLQDIIRRFFLRNTDWTAFPDKVVIQLNDTHPVIAIPELLAPPDRPVWAELGRGVGDHEPHLCLHLSYAAPRGARKMAG